MSSGKRLAEMSRRVDQIRLLGHELRGAAMSRSCNLVMTQQVGEHVGYTDR